jgi:cytochrome c
MYTPKLPDGDDDGRGRLVIRAVYSDNGAQGAPAHTADAVAVLRGPQVSAGSADILDGVTTTVENRGAGPVAIVAHANSHIAFRGIDLTGIRRAELAASATARQGSVGGTVEIRLDSPTGTLLAQTTIAITPPPPANVSSQLRAAPVMIALLETRGTHDVYFVFKNDFAAPIQSLMTLSTITWLNQ